MITSQVLSMAVNPGKERPFGIVIPAFGHPKFLAEAIVSACEQVIDRPVRVIVVDDGCRFEETGDTVASLLPLYEGSLFYLRQKNTRLPGARNSGIRFLLNLEPDLEAIYFLDADNRIAPTSLQVFWDALGDDPTIGWAYPDITFFGLTRGESGFDTRETAPTYSELKHLVGNISEAGSMVRADMCRAGVLFDETMTSGLEDWEFWLSALEAGYRGVRAADSGFMYRGRPESMLADSRRVVGGLVEKIRTKHKALYNPKHIMQLEHKEAPTFAFYIPEDDKILLGSDMLEDMVSVSLSVFKRDFQAWAHSSVEHFFPTHVIVVPRAAWDMLKTQQRYLRWWLWKLRENNPGILFIKLLNVGRLLFHNLSEEANDQGANIMCVASSALWGRANNSDGSVVAPSIHKNAYLSLPFERTLSENDPAFSKKSLSAHFDTLTDGWFQLPTVVGHMSKSFSGPFSHIIRENFIPEICAVENREPFPACTNAQRTIVAFKADLLFKTSAMDKITSLLRSLRREGHETIVLLESEGDIENVHLPTGEYGWFEFVEGVIPFPLEGNELEFSTYLGQRYLRELTVATPDDMAIIARTADRLIACGPIATVEAFGEARLHGAPGHVYLAPEFMASKEQASLGLAKLLAFEHAVTTVVTDDGGYQCSMEAQGFPAGKFISEETFLQSLTTAD